MFFKLRSSYSVMRHIEINCCKYNAWLHHAAHRNVRIQCRILDIGPVQFPVLEKYMK